MSLGKKLAWYRNKAGHTQESLAAESGMARPAISALERNKGGSPTIETLEKLLIPCGVTLDEFFRNPDNQGKPIEKPIFHTVDMHFIMSQDPDGSFAMKLIDVVFNGLKSNYPAADASKIKEPISEYGDATPPVKLLRIPYYGTIAAGSPRETHEPGQLWIDVAHEKIKASWYALEVRGDSMEPDYQNGDVVLIDRYIEAKKGDIVAALIGRTESTLKKYSRKGDEITLTPINPAHEPTTYHADQIEIHGVLIEILKRKA